MPARSRTTSHGRRRFVGRAVGCSLAVLIGALAIPALTSSAGAAGPPTAVAIPGDLDHLLGCSSDWAPDCDQAQMTRQTPTGVWSLTAPLPAGSYNYKAALNKSWDVNYGQNAVQGGANLSLTVPTDGASVTFLYDETTHLVTDSLSTPVAIAVGDFQQQLGCAADASATCLGSWLEDPDGDGTATFTTTALKAGSYHAQTAVGLTNATVYGQDGTLGGAPNAFTVAGDGAVTTFSYNASSHQLSVYPGQPKPSLLPRTAYWLSRDYIAWDLGPDPAHHTYQLAAAPDGGLAAGGTSITGGTTIPLTYDPAGLPKSLKAARPDLAGLGALRLPPRWAAKANELLRGQVAVASLDAPGNLTAATGLQVAGALDSLYAHPAQHTQLGPVFHAGRPTVSVWAPTAHSVSLTLYDTATSDTPRRVAMRRDDRTGTWSVAGDRSWKGKFYLFEVTVWAPSTGRMVTNHVTDPYALALSTDSQRSQIVDLDDSSLAPSGWQHTTSPPAIPATRQEIQELHVRDFSVADTTVPAERRGTYLAFTQPTSAGMKHLKALAAAGVTTVQLTPVFDFAGTAENRADQATAPCDLGSYAPDSDQQQACVARAQSTDAYNWGYNPYHFTVPEGSYATDPNGSARTLQFRQMVQSLHQAGLRVVMDVVYNHTAASGQGPASVLDRIVPGYYQRLNADGAVTTDSCCSDTAPENAMMNKLVVDSVTTWAKQYHVDGFRFDLMGLDPKQTMLDVKSSLAKLTVHRDGIDGTAALLYGEGWNYGIVANDARFVQATQANMAGTGIGTFNDRLRDGVRGGGPSDADPRTQGFASGQYTNPNGAAVNGTPAQQQATLLHDTDLVQLGLTGNLADYTFTSAMGKKVKGSGIDYHGSPAGYTANPGEAITYVDAHDNLTLFDALAYKLPTTTSMTNRARLQALAQATATLSQGPGFALGGSDLLHSKSLDGNSYDSGDWFNAIRWDCADGNGFGHGLPLASVNQAQWPLATPLLANPSLVPSCAAVKATTGQFQQFTRIKNSSPLFSLTTGRAVQQRVTFPLSGTAGQSPGVVTERLDGTGMHTYRSITVIYNATATTQKQTVSALTGTRQSLHPVQAAGNDSVVTRARFDTTHGTFTVPAYTLAVFVQN